MNYRINIADAIKILSTDLRRITHSLLLNIINDINVMLEYNLLLI